MGCSPRNDKFSMAHDSTSISPNDSSNESSLQLPSTEERISHRLSQEFDSPRESMGAFLSLLKEGWTIPYLARFRKHELGGMNEKRMYEIRERFRDISLLEERKTHLVEKAKSLGIADDRLVAHILSFKDIDLLDALFSSLLREEETVGAKGRQAGLLPLAAKLKSKETEENKDPLDLAAEFVNPESGVPDAKTALELAKGILTEEVLLEPGLLEELLGTAIVRAKKLSKKKAPKEFARFANYEKPASQVSWNDVLLLQKASRKGFIELFFGVPDERAHLVLTKHFVPHLGDPASPLRSFWDALLREAWESHLRGPFLTAIHRSLKNRADATAARIFSQTYQRILMAPPIPGTVIAGVLPAMRKPLRATAIDPHGRILGAQSLQAAKPELREEAQKNFRAFCEEHGVEVVAVGSGPGCREAETFLMEAVFGMDKRPQFLTVAEDEAAVLARREFKGVDLPKAKAAILARRVQNPLTEWGRFEADKVPLGYAQEEVRPSTLTLILDDVRERDLHQVGVDLRTAPVGILSKISGLNRESASAIAKMRTSQEGISTLRSLVDSGILSEQDYEQAAPFVRLAGGEEPLDATRIPPSLFGIVDQIASSIGLTRGQLLMSPENLTRIPREAFDRENLPKPIYDFIVHELRKPFQDPREPFVKIDFPPDLKSREDLVMGREVKGRVLRFTSTGAILDIGAAPAGFLHRSQMAREVIRNPSRFFHIGQVLDVRILDVDPKTGEIWLTRKQGEIRKIQRTLGDVAAGKKGPGAEVVSPGSARREEGRGRSRVASAGGFGRREGGGRGGPRKPGGREERGSRREAWDRRSSGGRGTGKPRGPITVESKNLDEAIIEERGFKGELTSFSALAALLKGKNEKGAEEKTSDPKAADSKATDSRDPETKAAGTKSPAPGKESPKGEKVANKDVPQGAAQDAESKSESPGANPPEAGGAAPGANPPRVEAKGATLPEAEGTPQGTTPPEAEGATQGPPQERNSVESEAGAQTSEQGAPESSPLPQGEEKKSEGDPGPFGDSFVG
ncbi:MAG TPA: S1 RNA-binding domain-containing protein [Planctomycetes bacterium]|nr:S1 RNA-binding domain-containing protein [Planctomycetota bacterium]